ncbi:MAG: cupin domain-containing protein [Bacteroidetes bacterium HGW-Bacteroidetes-21]|jgi:quercetin dioxygenase-like cupin family protein|nr:MAG: cupin domain-containing protein [Bacteroidetes bacterium HGW-Bacteroidetes-21]
MSQEAFKKAEKFTLNNSVDYTDGGVISKIITRNNAGNITLFSFDEQQSLSEHTAPFDAMVQIIEGEAMITINKVQFQLLKGECLIMPANEPHAVYAKTRFKMLLTMIKG